MQQEYRVNKSGLDHHLIDVDGVYARKPFTRDDFKFMINKTFLEYYGKFKDQFNPDEYLQCVDNDGLLEHF